VLQTLIKYDDPNAKQILLQEMDSEDLSRCLRAITLAGVAQNREASKKLIEFLRKRGLNKKTFPIKKAAVHALGEIGDPAVLPILASVLKTRSLLYRQKLHLLKIAIIESFAGYPVLEVTPILEDITSKGPRVLNSQTSMIMNRLRIKTE
jgi:HEAT repeat protein